MGHEQKTTIDADELRVQVEDARATSKPVLLCADRRVAHLESPTEFRNHLTHDPGEDRARR